MDEMGNEIATNGTSIAANFTDGILTWPEVALILGVVWAVLWCIKDI